MNTPRLAAGDCVGIVCPSHIADLGRYDAGITALTSMQLTVKLGRYITSDTHGYLASPQERAEDFHAMVLDDEVKLVFFGGGEGGNELLPLLDFDAIREHPKGYASHSDGTTLLCAIHAKTGLTVHYGQSPAQFFDLRYFDHSHFAAHFLGAPVHEFLHGGPWRTVVGGECEGKLLGGYLRNFAMQLGNRYFGYNTAERHLLFLEDHERFNDLAAVSAFLSHIEQDPFIDTVCGLLFGHYADEVSPHLLARLRRFGEAHGIPVVHCDDFGHGARHGILPIGRNAYLDANAQRLEFRAHT